MPAETVIGDYLKAVKIGRKQTHKNLGVFPLLSTYSLDADYLLLSEALALGAVEIGEVSQEGSVPNLRVINRSPRPVLILDGEELVGARQNRIVNTTILVQGGATIIIPVSCVEQGRWTYRSPTFMSEERIMSSSLRAMKAEHVSFSVRETGKYRSNQGAIWHEIEDKATRRGARSPGMAMSEIYEKERPSLEEYVKHFRAIDSQVGAVFMVNGGVAGLDAFGKTETFSKVFRKLLESYALDAIDWYEPENEAKAFKGPVTEFLRAALIAEAENHPSVGAGTDYRLSSEKVTGFALCLEGKVLHLSIFAREDRRGPRAQGSRITRFSQRSKGRN